MPFKKFCTEFLATFALVFAGTGTIIVNDVCDGASAERCPIFPGGAQRLHWSFPDPSALAGTHEEKLARTREIRGAIESKVLERCGAVCAA